MTGLKRENGPPIPAGCWAASPAEGPWPFCAPLVRAGVPRLAQPHCGPREDPRSPHGPASCQPCCLAEEACEHDSVSLQKQQRKQESAVSCILIFKPIS